jgi:hypothetical protein
MFKTQIFITTLCLKFSSSFFLARPIIKIHAYVCMLHNTLAGSVRGVKRPILLFSFTAHPLVHEI